MRAGEKKRWNESIFGKVGDKERKEGGDEIRTYVYGGGKKKEKKKEKCMDEMNWEKKKIIYRIKNLNWEMLLQYFHNKF